jgi:hypothetical protein
MRRANNSSNVNNNNNIPEQLIEDYNNTTRKHVGEGIGTPGDV